MKEKYSIKLTKFALMLIPVVIMIFLIYSNIFASKDFHYFYDIGSEKDNFLSPAQRISEKISEEKINYRNLTSNLVYFNVPITKNSESLTLKIKFKDNFAEEGSMSIGAKDQQEWHYLNKKIFDKKIENLFETYPSKSLGNLILFKVNPDVRDYSIEEFLINTPPRTFSHKNLSIPNLKMNDYTPKEFTIDTALRGNQIFYVYVKGDFSVKVSKRDLNWYDNAETGKDIVTMNLYHLNGSLISKEIILDDDEDEAKSDKNNRREQSGTLTVQNIPEGVYKLELVNNGDLLITSIKFNQNKVVLYKNLFLAQSEAYFNNFERTSKVFFKLEKPTEVIAQSWHDHGVNQLIRINEYEIKMKEKTSHKYTKLIPNSSNFYQLSSSKNDVLITGPLFFSFSEESWFDASKYNPNLINVESADYLLYEYDSPKQLGEWKIAEVNFNISDTYVQNQQLSMLISVPHLTKEDFKTSTIPIDWIDILVHKKGLIEKWSK